jgi:hypothetical protein
VLKWTLSKPSGSRTPQELKLIKWVFGSLTVFQEALQQMNEKLCGKLLNSLTYEYAPRGTVIFNYGKSSTPHESILCVGEIGTKWYFVIRGSCLIIIPKGENDAVNPNGHFVRFDVIAQRNSERNAGKRREGGVPGILCREGRIRWRLLW